MNWLLKLRDWVEGSHTPSPDERWASRSYPGQMCPCGAPATCVYQVSVDGKSGVYYTCSEHVRVALWIPNPADTGNIFSLERNATP